MDPKAKDAIAGTHDVYVVGPGKRRNRYCAA